MIINNNKINEGKKIMWNKGQKHSPETIKKMSDAQKGEKNTFFGKKHSEASKKKMSVFRTGHKFTEEQKEKISISRLRKKASERPKIEN